MASKKELTPVQAAFTLRALEGFMSIALRSKADEGEVSQPMESFVNDLHEAVDMACTALLMMGDNSLDIEEGGRNDRRGKTSSGDN